MSEQEGSNRVAGEELRGYVERAERIDGEKQALSDDLKVIFAEAKSAGYTPKYIRAIMRLRKKSPSEREEDEAMMDLYASALGMSGDAPLFRHVAGMGGDSLAREKVIEALKLLAPEGGEITIKVGGGPRVRLWRDKEGVHSEDVPDAPPPAPPADDSRPARGESAHGRPGAGAPNCNEDQAFALGQQARRDDVPVIGNPFAWDDARRRRWDEGWRDEDGGDGMGPQ